MSFGRIDCDDKVFTGDQLRVDVSKSILLPTETKADPTFYEISFDLGTTWFDISQTGYIDYMFSTPGNKTIQFRLTTDLGSDVFTKVVECLDLTAQNLFSLDFDLYPYEPDINKWLPNKWSSWNLIHLRSQNFIINSLYEKRIFKEDGSSYTKDDVFEIDKVKDWSAALSLYYIFEGLSNQVDDIYREKMQKYEKLASDRAATAQFKLDFNSNDISDEGELTDNRSVELIRR